MMLSSRSKLMVQLVSQKKTANFVNTDVQKTSGIIDNAAIENKSVNVTSLERNLRSSDINETIIAEKSLITPVSEGDTVNNEAQAVPLLLRGNASTEVKHTLVSSLAGYSRNSDCMQTVVPENSPNKSNSSHTGYKSDESSCSSGGSSCSSCGSSCSSGGSSSSSEDCEDLLFDKTYVPVNSNNGSDSEDEENIQSHTTDPTTSISTMLDSNPSTTPSAGNDIAILTSPLKKGRKRKRNENLWKRNLVKMARNSGKAYQSHSSAKKIRPERSIKPVCTEKCKLQCSTKFTEEQRQAIFSEFWALGNIERQRQFISNSMQVVQPKYRYVRIGGTRCQRQNNNAFFLNKDSQRVHVCKLFFKNTLDINDRPIRTVLQKQKKVADVLLEEDQRGKHGKQKKVDENVRLGIIKFIQSIPRIESHYTRANTSKQFIDGSKTIAQIHKDYVAYCKEKNVPYGNYVLFYRIFTTEFNISFFVPKKDLCDTCNAYDNSVGEEKEQLKVLYEQHLEEKIMSRAEKQKDKQNSEAIVQGVYKCL